MVFFTALGYPAAIMDIIITLSGAIQTSLAYAITPGKMISPFIDRRFQFLLMKTGNIDIPLLYHFIKFFS